MCGDEVMHLWQGQSFDDGLTYTFSSGLVALICDNRFASCYIGWSLCGSQTLLSHILPRLGLQCLSELDGI
jgi:hypothetical protein